MPDIRGNSVVVVGNFNSAIFSPEWFRSNGLLPDDDVDAAQISENSYVTSRVTQWSTEWLYLQCLPERFAISTNHAERGLVIQDLALGILRLLPHTPVRALGINHMAHIALDADHATRNILSRMVTADLWSHVLENPETSQLIVKSNRPDNFSGNILVRIEPSQQIANGIFIDINDHFDLSGFVGEAGAKSALDLISSEWNNCDARAQNIFDFGGR